MLILSCFMKAVEICENKLAMEKEQIKIAFENGEHNIDAVGNLIDIKGAEQYYNQTYNQNES